MSGEELRCSGMCERPMDLILMLRDIMNFLGGKIGRITKNDV